MTGLGILSVELCNWAVTATPEMVDASLNIIGHPVVKAKPGPVVGAPVDAGLLARINCWVDDNPFLAVAVVAAGYLFLRKK